MNLAIHRRICAIGALLAMTASAIGSTLVFMPQWDNVNSRTNYSWFYAVNWFITDENGEYEPAGRVPIANDSAIITSLADVEASGVRVQNLLLTNNAVVSNGTFSVQKVVMLSGSSFKNVTNNVLISLNVGGTNCTLDGALMNILSFAYATFAPVAPATASTLTLERAAVLQNSGTVILAGDTPIMAGSPPQSTLVIAPQAVLIATNLTSIQGTNGSHLIVDNSGLIRADKGTLRFDNGIDWRCSAGSGEFRAAAVDALILFASGFGAQPGTTSLFTGAGTNRWPSANTINGTAQVGARDPNTGAFLNGNLEILSSCSGAGSIHVTGDPAQTAVLNWQNGTLSLAAINVDAYGTMLISGGAGTSRQLFGCMLNNAGTCSVLGVDFTLAEAAVLDNSGKLFLNGGSRIVGGGVFQSGIVIEPGGVLSAANLTSIEGSSSSHLIVDNSGLIRVESGTLRFDNGIDWSCGGGKGEFRAAAANSLILFATGFHADSGTTSQFTGPGTNRWASSGTIDGIAQVGALDPNSQAFITGNLEIPSSYSGLGSVHVLGNPGQPAVLSWINGTMRTAAINVDPNATMLIGGGTGTSRQLSACALNNRGLCRLMSPDLALSQGAAINNLAGGTFELLADGTFSGAPAPAGGAFNNTGTFRKATPGTTVFGVTVPPQGPDFNNAGLVDLVSGQLNLMGGTSSGLFQTAAGAVLWFWGSTHTLSMGATFTGPGSVRLYQGASAPRLFIKGIISAADLEIGANGLVVGSVNVSGNPSYLGTLIVSANGSISNGFFAVQNAQMLDGSTFAGLSMNIVSNLYIGGTNCVLDNATVQIASSASATVGPVPPATSSALTLAEGSILWNSGRLMLNGGSKIAGGSFPQSGLFIDPGAVLSSTNLNSIEGSAAGHLIVDNSGLIRVDGGTLRFDNGIDWYCGNRTGEFKAASASSLILFATGFHADGGTTSRFTGPGTNRWASSSSIDGVAQVGARDPNSQAFTTGNLEIMASCSGSGSLHVLGNPGQPAVLYWKDGTMSVGAINLDPGATMPIGNGSAASRRLSGCVVNNQGSILLYEPTTVPCGNGTILNNLSGGKLDIQADAALTYSNASPMLVINNGGRFVKSGGTQTSLIAANLNNYGSIEVEKGTLQFQGSWNQIAGSTVVDAGTVLGGTRLSLEGGTLGGTGTIKAVVDNDGGVISPGGSPGTLSIGSGGSYEQEADGGLRIELGGYTAGTQYDQLVVGANASLGGTLELVSINGFVPKAGDQFQVLTCGSRTGQFDQINGAAGSGLVWVGHYTGTNVSAVLANEVQVTQPRLSGATLSFSFNTTFGLTYVVQESDSLNPPYWRTLREFAGDGTNKTVSDPSTQSQRYYRILIQ